MHNAKRWGELDTRTCIISRPRTATFLSSILLLLVIDTHAEAVHYCTNWTTSGLQFSDNALHIRSWQNEERVATPPPFQPFPSHMGKIWDQNGEWHSCRAPWNVSTRDLSGYAPRFAIWFLAQYMHIRKAQRRECEERGTIWTCPKKNESNISIHFLPLLTYNIQRCVSPFLSLSCCRSYCTLTDTRSNIQATRCTERFTLLRLRK